MLVYFENPWPRSTTPINSTLSEELKDAETCWSLFALQNVNLPDALRAWRTQPQFCPGTWQRKVDLGCPFRGDVDTFVSPSANTVSLSLDWDDVDSTDIFRRKQTLG